MPIHANRGIGVSEHRQPDIIQPVPRDAIRASYFKWQWLLPHPMHTYIYIYRREYTPWSERWNHVCRWYGSTRAGVGVHTGESRSWHVRANDWFVRVSDQITATQTTFSADLHLRISRKDTFKIVSSDTMDWILDSNKVRKLLRNVLKQNQDVSSWCIRIRLPVRII